MAGRPKVVEVKLAGGRTGWKFKGSGKIFKTKSKANKKRNKMYPKKKRKNSRNG